MQNFVATHELVVLKSDNKSFPTLGDKMIGVGLNPDMKLDVIVLADIQIGHHPEFRTALFGEMVLDEPVDAVAVDPDKKVFFISTRTWVIESSTIRLRTPPKRLTRPIAAQLTASRNGMQ